MLLREVNTRAGAQPEDSGQALDWLRALSFSFFKKLAAQEKTSEPKELPVLSIENLPQNPQICIVPTNRFSNSEESILTLNEPAEDVLVCFPAVTTCFVGVTEQIDGRVSFSHISPDTLKLGMNAQRPDFHPSQLFLNESHNSSELFSLAWLLFSTEFENTYLEFLEKLKQWWLFKESKTTLFSSHNLQDSPSGKILLQQWAQFFPWAKHQRLTLPQDESSLLVWFRGQLYKMEEEILYSYPTKSGKVAHAVKHGFGVNATAQLRV